MPCLLNALLSLSVGMDRKECIAWGMWNGQIASISAYLYQSYIQTGIFCKIDSKQKVM